MIAVLMVDGQQLDACCIKFTAAFGADRSVNLQRLRPVVGVAVHLTAHPLEYGSGLIGVGEGDCTGAS